MSLLADFRERLVQIEYAEGGDTNWIPLYLQTKSGNGSLAGEDEGGQKVEQSVYFDWQCIVLYIT